MTHTNGLDHYRIGNFRGISAASWIEIDSEAHAKRLLQMWDDGDPEVMDLQPAPLSGEQGGESMIELLGENYTEDDAEQHELGFSDGFWDTFQTRCKCYLS